MDVLTWVSANSGPIATALAGAGILSLFWRPLLQKVVGLATSTATDQAAFDAAFTLRAYFTKTKSDAGMEATKGVLVALCNERPLPQAPPQVPPT